MANCKVTVLVESITVVSNGDVPGSRPNHAGGLKNNAISATLVYPRGGRPEIASVIQADLKDNVPYEYDTADFYGPAGDGVQAPGLFKEEEIEEECPLRIQVTSNDDASHLALVLEKVFTNLVGAAVFVVPGGQLVSAAVEFAAESLGDIIAGQSKGSIEVIGACQVMLNAAELLAGPNPLRMTLPLIAPKTIHKGWFLQQMPPGGGPSHWLPAEGDLTVAGQPNGRITLMISILPA
ncbi:MAG TPA: hypothetical protein VFN53_10630 [Acidobacteriaceae bacterium]|nr:hypothetical protein [Acidobacteriaceae bacterium]